MAFFYYSDVGHGPILENAMPPLRITPKKPRNVLPSHERTLLKSQCQWTATTTRKAAHTCLIVRQRHYTHGVCTLGVTLVTASWLQC